MATNSLLSLLGILWISWSTGGANSLPCLNLNDTYSEHNVWDLCLDIRSQNGYCVVDGSYGCNASRNNKDDFGCQDHPPAPYISVYPAGSFPFYPLGTDFTMTCNTDLEMVTNYFWYTSGQEITGENSMNLTVSESLGSTNFFFSYYTCQYIFDQRASKISSSQRASPLRDVLWTITPSPALMGVPSSVVEGMLLELMCINYPYDGFSIAWYFNNVVFATTVNSNVYKDFLVNSTTAGGSLKCTISLDNLRVKVDTTPDVIIPNLPDSNATGLDNLPLLLYISLEGNHFNTGDSVEMLCAFNDSAFTARALSQLPVTVAWYVNGRTLPAFTTMEIEVSSLEPALHHGNWSCSVQLNDDEPIYSPPIFMYVDGTLEVQMSTFPELPIMGGTLLIFCRYDYLYDSEASSVGFEWTFNDTILLGYNTDFLYVSSLAQSVTGIYTCTVSIENGRNATHSFYVGNPVSFEGIPRPSLGGLGFEPGELLTFGVYQLQCVYDISYATFGINITFFKDGQITIPEGPEEDPCTNAIPYDGTFNISLINDVYDHDYTCRVEFGDKFFEESNALTVSFLVLDSLNVVDEHGDQSTVIHRFVGDMLHLECEASLFPNFTSEVNYTWYNGNGVVFMEGAVLYTTVDEVQDTIYTCEARVGSHRLRIDVSVRGHENQAPSLTLVDKPEDGLLLFNETYELFCDMGNITDIPGMQIEFSEDGDVIYIGDLPRYTITNDINSKNYTCKAVGQLNTTSSNSVIASFRTIDRVEIQSSDRETAPSVITADVNKTITLICSATLSNGVPEHVNATYNWYDLDQMSHGNSPELEVQVTLGFKATLSCSVEVGDYLVISTNNVKFHCSACACSFWLLRRERIRKP